MLIPLLLLFAAGAAAPLVHRLLGRRGSVALAAVPALLFAHFLRFVAPVAALVVWREARRRA